MNLQTIKAHAVERGREYSRRGDTAYRQPTRIYVWPKGETILENLSERRARPYEEWRKLLPKILKLAGFDPQMARFAQWRQKAGCPCGCSPAFILKDHVLRTDEFVPVDIHADVGFDSTTVVQG